MKKALDRYSIVVEPPVDGFRAAENPDVSFIIGHRGLERLPLLLLTLKTIANQRGVSLECVVVEESRSPKIADRLPAWVRYIHAPVASSDQPYNRARTFNIGASAARGRLLVFHDNDMLMPSVYALELFKSLEIGYQVLNLKRFIFYLTESHTGEIVRTNQISWRPPDFVLQNSTGGGSLAVEKEAFLEVGGFDEGFVGWGGEDVEFWDRAQVLRVNNFGYLPFIHLWHPPQPEKNEKKDSQAMRRLSEVLAISPEKRIATLKRLSQH